MINTITIQTRFFIISILIMLALVGCTDATDTETEIDGDTPVDGDSQQLDGDDVPLDGDEESLENDPTCPGGFVYDEEDGRCKPAGSVDGDEPIDGDAPADDDLCPEGL